MKSRENVGNLTDEELYEELREQVNKSRYGPHGHDRERTRAIAEELHRRKWLIPKKVTFFS